MKNCEVHYLEQADFSLISILFGYKEIDKIN